MYGRYGQTYGQQQLGSYQQMDYISVENYLGTNSVENFEPVEEKKEGPHVTWSPEHVHTTANPKIWGPSFWFTLHVSAAHYPLNPSPLVKERMKGRLLALPYEIPCAACRTHAISFIEAHRDKLDSIVGDRHSLGKFYVDFHNKVNERYNKPTWTYEQALKFYSGPSTINRQQYS